LLAIPAFVFGLTKKTARLMPATGAWHRDNPPARGQA
jgi:hypothetical protein